jgi:hypothetical protein
MSDFDETVIKLQKTPKREIPRFLPTNVADDGSIVVTSQARFWHWSKNGDLIQSTAVSSKPNLSLFMDVRFDAERKVYWIATFEGSALVLSDSGDILSREVPPPVSPNFKDLSYRFLIPSNTYTFGVAKGFGSLKPKQSAAALTPLLLQDETVVSADLFSDLNELHIQTQFNYKEHWVIYDQAQDGYYIMSAMARFIRFYKNEGSVDEPKFVEKFYRPFYKTDDFIIPDLTAPRRISNMKEMMAWFQQFPRITGFFKFGDGFLICYSIPNLEEKGVNRQVLHRLDKKGGLIGSTVESKAKVIGAHDESIYTLERGDFGLRLKLLKFKD